MENEYLGCIIDDRLSWQENIKKRINLARVASLKISHLFYSNKVTLKNKMFIYNQIIRPMIIYASPAWIGAKPYILNKISSFENAVLRKIVGFSRYIPNDIIKTITASTPINTFVMENARMYFEKQKEIKNTSIQESIDYDETMIFEHPLPRNTIYQYSQNISPHQQIP